MLLARVTDDGYLLGCTNDLEHGYEEQFWADYYTDAYDAVNTHVIAIVVPPDMVKHLLDHGTSDQWYSDGYAAWQDIIERAHIIDSIEDWCATERTEHETN